MPNHRRGRNVPVEGLKQSPMMEFTFPGELYRDIEEYREEKPS